MTRTTQMVVLSSDWLKENSLPAQPIRSTTKIWVVHAISMEFLRSLLRRRFPRAQVATLRNAACFLRLLPGIHTKLSTKLPVLQTETPHKFVFHKRLASSKAKNVSIFTHHGLLKVVIIVINH